MPLSAGSGILVLGFAAYLLILFPLTFVVMSQRILRLVAVILATSGLTLLLVDTEVFSQFHLHLSPVVWEILVNPDDGELSRNWQLLFVAVPLIFLIELLFANWSWNKLRSLSRRTFDRYFAVLFIACFITAHLVYSWADATLYRPITMQKANLPLYYPMTAKRFWSVMVSWIRLNTPNNAVNLAAQMPQPFTIRVKM